MREGARRVIITVSALALIGITVFCISGTVHSSEKVERREREKYYREIEAEYVKEVRFFLNEEGYSNSGVTMTKAETTRPQASAMGKAIHTKFSAPGSVVRKAAKGMTTIKRRTDDTW